MVSLGYAVSNVVPRQAHSISLVKNITTTQKSCLKFSDHQKDSFSQSLELKGHETLLRRREAIGLAIGLVDVLLHLQPAKAAETAPCELTIAPSGLAFCDKTVGYGPQAIRGQLIKAHYVGKLENGTIFDSSYNRGKPLTFRVGVGEVIKGWDEGIIGGDGVPPMLAGANAY